MKYLAYIIIFLLASVISCQPKSQSNQQQGVAEDVISSERLLSDSCTISGITFLIFQQDNLAFLEAQGLQDTIYGKLSLRAPVYFVRTAMDSNTVLTYSYPQFEAEQVLMLFGEQMNAADQAERGLTDTDWCGTKIQGLILEKDRAVLTKDTFEAYKCKGQSSDEKDFYTLAEADR